MSGTDGDFVAVARFETEQEAEEVLGSLARRGIVGTLQADAPFVEVVVPAVHAAGARRVLMEERLEAIEQDPDEFPFVLKLALLIALLGVVAFAVATVVLG